MIFALAQLLSYEPFARKESSLTQTQHPRDFRTVTEDETIRQVFDNWWAIQSE